MKSRDVSKDSVSIRPTAGTAGPGQTPVLGRELEPEGTWRVRGHEPLAGAAPDLISAATESAARALGWNDAASTSELASLDGVGGDLGRSTTDRASRAPAEDSALDLADLLEGEELDVTDIAIELDES